MNEDWGSHKNYPKMSLFMDDPTRNAKFTFKFDSFCLKVCTELITTLIFDLFPLLLTVIVWFLVTVISILNLYCLVLSKKGHIFSTKHIFDEKTLFQPRFRTRGTLFQG